MAPPTSETVRTWTEDSLSCDPWETFQANYRTMPLDDTDAVWIDRDTELTAEEVRRELGPQATPQSVDRLLFERHIARGTVPEPEPYLVGRGQWFDPAGQPTAILFTPTGDPWVATAYNSYWGSLGAPVPLVALAREWNRKWGAEIVASWNTMLQFTLARPPTDIEDAWTLAGQHLNAAGNLDMDQSQLAVALLASDAWFLHDRPLTTAGLPSPSPASVGGHLDPSLRTACPHAKLVYQCSF